MTQANTDYLLSLTAPVTDRTYSAPPASDSGSRFGDHLNQARTQSSDDLFAATTNSVPRTESTRYHRDDRDWSSQDSAPARNETTSAPPASTPPARSSEPPVQESNESAPATDESQNESDEVDELDETTAAEAAGATGAAKTPKKDEAKSKSEQHSEHAAVDAAVAAKKAAVEPVEKKTKATPVESAERVEPEGETEATAEETRPTGEATTPKIIDEAATGEAEPVATDKKAKATKNDAEKEKNAKADQAAVEAASAESQQGEQASADAAQVVAGQAEAVANDENAPKPKVKSERDETAEEEPTAPVRNEQPAPQAKADAAQLVAAVPTTTSSDTGKSSEGKEGDQAVKPATAKGEPITAALARMTRNTATSTGDSQASNNDLPTVDPARFLGRVTKAFQTAQDRGGKVQLRLSPPELGVLRIELNVKDGAMSASVQAENSNARKLLLEHLPALRDRLAEQNIRVDRFDVDVRREGTEGQTDARGSQHEQFQNQSDQPAPRRPAVPQPQARTVAAEKPVSVQAVTDAGLNLVV